MRIVLVNWYDAYSDSDWRHIHEIKNVPAHHCQTVGWLVEETGREIKLIQTNSNDELCFNLTIIPKGMVISMVDLIEYTDKSK